MAAFFVSAAPVESILPGAGREPSLPAVFKHHAPGPPAGFDPEFRLRIVPRIPMNLRRQIIALLCLLPVAALAVPFAPAPTNASGFQPGKDYIELAAPLPTSTGNQLEVREFFFYGCSHCFDLEPAVTAWLKRKSADTAFVRTPAVLNPRWETLGRAFYVAEELKVLEKIHAPLYNALHVKRERLDSQESLREFFAGFGVPATQFDAAWNSSRVNISVKNASALAKKYMIQGTPTLAVNGKYLVPSSGDRTFAVVEFLLARERAARAGK